MTIPDHFTTLPILKRHAKAKYLPYMVLKWPGHLKTCLNCKKLCLFTFAFMLRALRLSG